MVKILQPLLLTYTNYQTMQHIEYPDLINEAQAILNIASQQLPDRIRRDSGQIKRRYTAAVIREATRRARTWNDGVFGLTETNLLIIANNLHLPPSPATKKEAAAALEWLQERAINDAHKAQLAKVTSYLASLPTSPNPP